MLLQKNKKIILYLFLFIIIGTLNNRNLRNENLLKDININVTGLDQISNAKLINNLNLLKMNNLFFLDEKKIKKILNSNNLIEKFFIFKKYPSTLDIKVYKTIFLAQLKKKDDIFFLGSNRKLIKSNKIVKDIPFIFGDFRIENFFQLKKAITKKNFNFKKIKNLFFFKSGRWDIETESGLLIKLPKENIQQSLELSQKILNKNDKKIKIIDLRQHKQVIINE